MTAQEEATALRVMLTQSRARAEQAMAAQNAEVAAATEALVRLARLEALLEPGTPPVDPPPVVVDPPAAPMALRARVGASTYPIAAVDPVRGPDRVHPGGREAEELVLYLRPGRTGTNAHGAEVVLTGGLAGGVAGPLVVGAAGGLAVVEGAPVLSGHGRALAWLRANVRPGVRVDIEQAVPVPDDGGVPGRPGGRTIAVYLKRGSAGANVLRASAAAGVNQARVAFLQGAPLQLVGWGGEPVPQLAAALAELRTDGGTALSSVGGKDGHVPGSDPAALVAGIRAAETTVGTRDGWDVDIEASAIDIDAIVTAAVTAALGREQTWITSFAPSGGDPVARYLEAAKECAAAGLRVQFGQQLYDARTHISVDEGIRATDRAVRALGDPSRVLIGMWSGPAAKQWTLAECERAMSRALDEWPTIGGCYSWTEGGGEIPAWAAAMARVLGQ